MSLSMACYSLSLLICTFVVPFGTYGLAIILGFPITGVMRKAVGLRKSQTIDIVMITLGANLIDGFVGVVVAYQIWRGFEMVMPVGMIWLLVLAKIIWVTYRDDLLSGKASEWFEEITNLFMYFAGLYGGYVYYFGFRGI